MSSEDQEILARISHVAGKINRHKNQQAGLTATSSSYDPSYHHASYGGNGYHRGAALARGGHRGGRPPTYRHRSLVLNGAGASSDRPSEGDSAANSDASNSSAWISKNDRHRQLINSSVYEKETKARTKAIEHTRIQKRRQRDDRERAKLIGHLSRMASGGLVTSAQPSAPDYEIDVQGVRFKVTKNGSKLVRVPGDDNSPKATPKTAVVGGVKFYRTKNGNLYRHGVVKAQRQSGVVKKVDVLCKLFSTTGSCANGPRCRYIHDASKVAACKEYLQRGQCAHGDACDLSHDLTPERTPACLHFAKGNCTNPNCHYAHVIVSPGAPVCRSFGIYGYCEKGAECPDRHAFECPDFSNTGICKNKGCKLPHRERASVMRKAPALEDDEGMDDLSSEDDGDFVDSYDVDSDEVEEFIGQDDDVPDVDFAAQKDFIQL